jgi:hypothetical protein
LGQEDFLKLMTVQLQNINSRRLNRSKRWEEEGWEELRKLSHVVR